ncbi:MAG: Riboflavin synthase [Chlamydiales bacterium]|nr:Riboflavin synthase [Chlamydiales bacterium]MCH9635625.1 Riboflavin synthase [Chlamydiales bacterium]MCH9703296.1 riboflavin synthase [Chlamydiota bacterium]
MFTGIVRQKGRVTFIEKKDVLLYGVDFEHEDLQVGDSVAVDGVCQTVVSTDGAVFFEAIGETLERTTIADLAVGESVNIERSAKIGDEIGGHLLSGHVMEKGCIAKVEGNIYTIEITRGEYLFEKGFVAVDGMSLTVASCSPTSFTVHLIPETLRWFQKKEGELVNIEYDASTVTCVETIKRVQPHCG